MSQKPYVIKDGLEEDFDKLFFNTACGKCGKLIYWVYTCSEDMVFGRMLNGACCGKLYKMALKCVGTVSFVGPTDLEEEAKIFVPAKVILEKKD